VIFLFFLLISAFVPEATASAAESRPCVPAIQFLQALSSVLHEPASVLAAVETLTTRPPRHVQLRCRISSTVFVPGRTRRSDSSTHVVNAIDASTVTSVRHAVHARASPDLIINPTPSFLLCA
jgi:hypothetical protein